MSLRKKTNPNSNKYFWVRKRLLNNHRSLFCVQTIQGSRYPKVRGLIQDMNLVVSNNTVPTESATGNWKLNFHTTVCLVLCLVAQSCLTLCNPMDCSCQTPLSMVILQARILECVAISFSRASSQPRDRTQVSRTAGGFFTVWATREARNKTKQSNSSHLPSKKTDSQYLFVTFTTSTPNIPFFFKDQFILGVLYLSPRAGCYYNFIILI